MTRKELGNEGTKPANRALKTLPEFAKAEAQETFNVTAFQFARMAAAKAPRRTGKLADDIAWESRPRSLSAVVTITKNAFYWWFQEYGTRNHKDQSFLRPTAVKLEDDHHNRLLQALGRALGKMERAQRG